MKQKLDESTLRLLRRGALSAKARANDRVESERTSYCSSTISEVDRALRARCHLRGGAAFIWSRPRSGRSTFAQRKRQSRWQLSPHNIQRTIRRGANKMSFAGLAAR